MNENTMEIVADTKNAYDIKAKGSVAKLPKVKKAIIGRADINSYGKNENKGKMVGSKYQILVILGEDWNGMKKDTCTTANAILYKMGVKTFPVFTDFEKAKVACKRVSKWGKEERVVTPRKVKAVSAKDISIENLSEEEKKALIARLMAA